MARVAVLEIKKSAPLVGVDGKISMKSSAEWLKHVRKHVDIHAMDSTEMAAAMYHPAEHTVLKTVYTLS